MFAICSGRGRSAARGSFDGTGSDLACPAVSHLGGGNHFQCGELPHSISPKAVFPTQFRRLESTLSTSDKGNREESREKEEIQAVKNDIAEIQAQIAKVEADIETASTNAKEWLDKGDDKKWELFTQKEHDLRQKEQTLRQKEQTLLTRLEKKEDLLQEKQKKLESQQIGRI